MDKLKLAGLYDSDSSALTQSGDEVEESSPPPQDPSRPGTEVETEVGEEEDMEVAERSSLGECVFRSCYRLGLAVSHYSPLMPLTQNLRQSRNRPNLRKLPRKARLLVLVQVRLLHPLDQPRNASGRQADRFGSPGSPTTPVFMGHGLQPIFLSFVNIRVLPCSVGW